MTPKKNYDFKKIGNYTRRIIMILNSITEQDSLEKKFNKIYASGRKKGFNNDFDNTREFEQQISYFLGQVERMLANACAQEAAQTATTKSPDANFNVNPSIEQDIALLSRQVLSFANPQFAKIFEYYRRIKLSQLVSRLVKADAEKMDEQYINDLKIYFKQLINRYIALLKEYKKQHKLGLELKYVAIVAHATQLIREDRADEVLHELVQIPNKDKECEYTIRAVFKNLRYEFKQAALKYLKHGLSGDRKELHDNFILLMRLYQEFTKSIQNLQSHLGQDTYARLIAKNDRKIKQIIDESNLGSLYRFLGAALVAHPNNATTDLFSSELKLLSPKEVVEAREIMIELGKNSSYMPVMLQAVDGHLAALVSKTNTPETKKINSTRSR